MFFISFHSLWILTEDISSFTGGSTRIKCLAIGVIAFDVASHLLLALVDTAKKENSFVTVYNFWNKVKSCTKRSKKCDMVTNCSTILSYCIMNKYPTGWNNNVTQLVRSRLNIHAQELRDFVISTSIKLESWDEQYTEQFTLRITNNLSNMSCGCSRKNFLEIVIETDSAYGCYHHTWAWMTLEDILSFLLVL